MQGNRVAAIIPVYTAEYLGDCLASVFAQTRRPDEIIVIDDGSPEPEVVRAALAPYGKDVTLLTQPNLGAGAARNHGILSTGADLIAFLDADDLWCPRFLEQQIGRLADGPGRTLVYTNARLTGDGPLAGRLFMDTAPSSGEVTVDALFNQRCTVVTSSVVVHRDALVKAGLFDADLRRAQDFDMWVRLAHQGARFAYTTEPLVVRRIHGQNLSGDTISELERAVAVFEKLSTKLTLNRQQRGALDARVRVLRAGIHTEHGKSSLRAGDFADARARFRQAAREGASWKSQIVNLALQIAPELTRQAYLLKVRLNTVPTLGGAAAHHMR